VIVYRTGQGWFVEQGENYFMLKEASLNALIQREDLHAYLASIAATGDAADSLNLSALEAPIESQEVRIRGDAKWSVPEPELALFVNPRGEIVGYTIGNDMSSRDIEGANPLYLPQAKVYDRSCALGPGILIRKEPMPRTTEIGMEILRSGRTEFSAAITLAEMKRDPAALVEYLYRYQSFPYGCFLLTGTGIVPPDTFTLRSGDEIRISIGGIGTLTNHVA